MKPRNVNIHPMASSPPSTDNIPNEGQVTSVCREWLVHEDQALAYRLQSEEYQHHLGHNKERNALLRQDTPRAREEQFREDEEAAKAQNEIELSLVEQEMRDAAIASRIARDLDRQEQENQKQQELKDRELAKSLGEHEKCKVRQAKEIRGGSRTRHNESSGSISTDGDRSEDLSDLSDFCRKPNTQMDEDEVRNLQEGQDEELARLLQEQDLKRRGDLLQEDQLVAIEAQDRELAKVLQEQERAKAKKAREKARQKAMLKKQHQPTQPQGIKDLATTSHDASAGLYESPTYETPNFATRERSNSPQYACPATIRGQASADLDRPKRAPNFNYESHTPARNMKPSIHNMPTPYETHTLEDECERRPSQFTNIACAIDPTYQRRVETGELSSPPPAIVSSVPRPVSSTSSNPRLPLQYADSPSSISTPAPLTFEEDDDDEYLPPPYMPIQGQRRIASLEKPLTKPTKKKTKESGCKQQ